MGKHLRKLFSSREVIDILKRYILKEIGVEQALGLLKIKRRRFFDVLRIYRGKPEAFSLDYQRSRPGNQIDRRTEQKIVKELKKEKELIEDKSNPIQFYNYSYLKNVLEEKHGVNVALSTIIRRAKKMGFIKKRNSESRTTGKS